MASVWSFPIASHFCLFHSFPDLRRLCACTARQSLRGFSVQVTARVAGMRVHMYNCAPACAVTRRSWSYLSCLHVLRSVSAAADPPFSASSAQLSWTCRARLACAVVSLRGARYCTRCVLVVVVICKSCGTWDVGLFVWLEVCSWLLVAFGLLLVRWRWVLQVGQSVGQPIWL